MYRYYDSIREPDTDAATHIFGSNGMLTIYNLHISLQFRIASWEYNHDGFNKQIHNKDMTILVYIKNVCKCTLVYFHVICALHRDVLVLRFGVVLALERSDCYGT